MSESLRTELVEDATAAEILRFALYRAREERRSQQCCVNDLYAELAYAEEQLRHAELAERTLSALLDSAEFKSGVTAPAVEVSAEIGQLAAGPARAPETPVETVNWRLARSPGEPIAAALDELASAVVVEAQEPAEAAPEPATHNEPHISAPVSGIEPEVVAQPEPIIEPISQPEPVSRFDRTSARPLTVPQIIAGKIMAAAPALFAACPDGVPITAIMEAAGSTYNQTVVALIALHKEGKVAWIKAANDHKHKLMLPAGTPAPVLALTANQEKVLDALSAAAVDGVAALSLGDIHRLTGVAHGSLPQITESLAMKGFIHRDAAAGKAATSYRVLKPSRAPVPAAPERAVRLPVTPAAPVRAQRPAARLTGRAMPRGAHFENLGGGVQVIRIKPVTESAARHAKAQLDRGADIEDVADLFDTTSEALERAIAALGQGAPS